MTPFSVLRSNLLRAGCFLNVLPMTMTYRLKGCPRCFCLVYFCEEWPVEMWLLTCAPDLRWMHEPLLSSKSPVFAGPQQEIDELTRVPISWRGWTPTIYFLMPDRRCKLANMNVTSTSVSRQMTRFPRSKKCWFWRRISLHWSSQHLQTEHCPDSIHQSALRYVNHRALSSLTMDFSQSIS